MGYGIPEWRAVGDARLEVDGLLLQFAASEVCGQG
jgi:hypothetical protein